MINTEWNMALNAAQQDQKQKISDSETKLTKGAMRKKQMTFIIQNSFKLLWMCISLVKNVFGWLN